MFKSVPVGLAALTFLSEGVMPLKPSIDQLQNKHHGTRLPRAQPGTPQTGQLTTKCQTSVSIMRS